MSIFGLKRWYFTQASMLLVMQEKFEQRKTELSSKSSKFTSGEGGTDSQADSQPSIHVCRKFRWLTQNFKIWGPQVLKVLPYRY